MARKSPPKTNAMRALDAHKIPYSTFFYAETIHSADEVAALLGVPAGHVYKTLVALADIPDSDLDARAPLPKNWKSPLVARWNVRYILTRSPISDPRLHADSVQDGVWVYRNIDCDPRAYVVHRVQAVPDGLTRLASGQGGFPAGIAYVSENSIPLDRIGPAEPVQSFRQPDPNHLVIDATSTDSGLLVIADTSYPGWTATIDGAAAPVVRVNGAMRGVYLPNGKHHVELEYECRSLAVGAGISAVALLAALGLVGRSVLGRQGSGVGEKDGARAMVTRGI